MTAVPGSYFLTQQLHHAPSELKKAVERSVIEEAQIFSSIQFLTKSEGV